MLLIKYTIIVFTITVVSFVKLNQTVAVKLHHVCMYSWDVIMCVCTHEISSCVYVLTRFHHVCMYSRGVCTHEISSCVYVLTRFHHVCMYSRDIIMCVCTHEILSCVYVLTRSVLLHSSVKYCQILINWHFYCCL